MPPFVGRKRHESDSPPAPPARKRAKNETPVKKVATPALKSSRGGTQKSQKSKPTVFDHVEAVKPSSSSARPANGKIFADVADSEDESDSDEVDSDEFEDVVHEPAAGATHESGGNEDEDEDEDWEDALHENGEQAAPADEVDGPSGPIEITLNQMEPEMSYAEFSGKKQGPSKKEKRVRETAHRMHVQFLMWHNYLRNHWLNDKEVQATMLSHVEQSHKMKLQIEAWRRRSGIQDPRTADRAKSSAKSKESPNQKSKGKGKGRQVEDANELRKKRDWIDPAERQAVGQPDLSRGDPVLPLLNTMSAWWRQRFTITAPGLRKHGYKPMRLIKEQLQAWRKGEGAITEQGEHIANVKEFRSCAKRCEGSRDVGAQLFAALLRALGIEARLVASLQPLGFGWTKHEEADKTKTQPAGSKSNTPKKFQPKSAAKGRGRPKASGKTKTVAIELSDTSDLSEAESDDSDASIVDITPRKRANMPYDSDMAFPTYWIEAVSSLTNRVFPVDPFVLKPSVATSAEHLALYEARGMKAENARQVFAYVVAFSPDRTAKDVTTRYLKKHIWPGKTKGFRMVSTKVSVADRYGRVVATYEVDWWKIIMRSYERPQNKRTRVDEVEDEAELRPVQPEKKAPKVGDPDTLDGYKRSEKFVLERHLRRDEALLPQAKQVKTFRTGKGENEKEEPVYLRRDVAVCRTSESWHKEGRQVKFGEQPLKMVPVRAVTLTRKREIQEAERASGEKATQGMYSKEQTEWIIPPPIRDGVIPKNSYGNMDAFVPQMIPRGAVHIPMRGTKRVCNKLGIDFAEAVTGFEFGNKMAVPVIEGVVVAEENRDLVVDAWEKAEEERKIREAAKREKEILSAWRKFLMGLRVLERMKAEYEIDVDHDTKERNPFMNRKQVPATQETPTKKSEAHDVVQLDGHDDSGGGFFAEDAEAGGGFFPEGHNVELPSHLSGKAKTEAADHHLEIEHEGDEEEKRSAPRRKAVSLAALAAQRETFDDDDDDQREGEGEEVASPGDKAESPSPERTAPNASKPARGRKAGSAAKTKAQAAQRPKATPRATPKATPKPTAKRGRPSKKAKSPSPPPDESDEDMADGSGLSDVSDDEDDAPPPPTPAPASTRSTRTSARSAAKASQQRIRSHYFKHESTEGEDSE